MSLKLAGDAIEYTTIERGWVELGLVDGLGRRVTTLVSEHQSPGRYRVALDRSTLPNGAYLCVLRSGGQARIVGVPVGL